MKRTSTDISRDQCDDGYKSKDFSEFSRSNCKADMNCYSCGGLNICENQDKKCVCDSEEQFFGCCSTKGRICLACLEEATQISVEQWEWHHENTCKTCILPDHPEGCLDEWPYQSDNQTPEQSKVFRDAVDTNHLDYDNQWLAKALYCTTCVEKNKSISNLYARLET